MASKDKTFSASDVIRIYLRELDPPEQIEVACYFELILKLKEEGELSKRLFRWLVGIFLGFAGPAGAALNLAAESIESVVDRSHLRECARRAIERGRELVP